MSDIAISVENLSKRYRIGLAEERHDTFAAAAMAALKAPLRNLQRLRRLSSFDERSNVPIIHPEQGEALERSNVSTFQRSNADDVLWALRDVSFGVKRGEVVGVIGRNGAGKSTLLKILSRITEPTSGRVILNGRVSSLLEVGTGFHPELTGRENIYLNGTILGMRKAEIDRKFDEIVDFSGVEKFIDTPVKRYSSGMRVRLAFSVAAHLEPEILLVDEVLAVGDAEFQAKCLGKMSSVAGEGRTILFVSHNMSAVQQLCLTSLLMERGKLQMAADTETVIDNYLSSAHRSDDGVFDLSSHPARGAKYVPLIRQVVLRSKSGNSTTLFNPGERVDIEIFVQSPYLIKEPRLAIAIEDRLSRRITTVASHFQTNQLPPLTGFGHFRCSIPQLRLGQGRYLLSVSVSAKEAGLLDSVNGALWFDVGWQNNYGNGEVFQPIYGPVLTDSKWERLSQS